MLYIGAFRGLDKGDVNDDGITQQTNPVTRKFHAVTDLLLHHRKIHDVTNPSAEEEVRQNGNDDVVYDVNRDVLNGDANNRNHLHGFYRSD